MPTSPASIEDVLGDVLGYSLSASGTGTGSADSSLRAASIGGAGGSPWFIPGELIRHYSANINHKPKFHAGGVTFWRWRGDRGASKFDELTVWIGRHDDAGSGGNKASELDGSASGGDNPMVSASRAWTALERDLPALVGPGTTFDPETLRVVNEALTAVGIWSGDVRNGLHRDMDGIDTNTDTFRGSAANGFRDRVENAARGVEGVREQSGSWAGPLDQAHVSAQNFMDALLRDHRYWRGEATDDPRGAIGGPSGAWTSPGRFVLALFNEASVQYAHGHTNHNADGRLWETGRVRAGKGTDELVFTFPGWADGSAVDALDPASWVAADARIRSLWASRVESSFAPTLAAARQLISALDGARAVRLGEMPPARPNPSTATPDAAYGMPTDGSLDPADLGAGAGGSSGGTTFADPASGDLEGAGLGSTGLGPVGVGSGGVGSGGVGSGGVGSGGVGSGGLGSGGLGSGGLGSGGLGSGGLGSGGLGSDGFGSDNLGSDGVGSGGLGSGGLGTGGINSRGGGSDGPDASAGGANGIGSGSGGMTDGAGISAGFGGYGALAPGSMGGIVAPTGGPGKNTAGAGSIGGLGGAGSPGFGDFAGSSAAGDLGDEPVTGAMLQQLRHDGLLPVGATTPHSLDDLTSGQLSALHRSGLLADPALGGFSSSRDGVFPTTIGGYDVTAPAGAGGAVGLGNVSTPVARSISGPSGSGGGGFGTAGVVLPRSAGGTGGTPDGIGLPVGGLTTAAGTTGSGGSAGGAGGMPFMPMGGMGSPGGGGQGSQRERATWLTEDEDVWGTDPECAPAVVGRGQGTPGGPGRPPVAPTQAPVAPSRIRRARG